jgi:glycosyltransferase involved in cell wall biosynthesis
MKIGIDARFLTHPQPGGFKTYTENLIHALARIDTENEYFIYTDRNPGDQVKIENPNFYCKTVSTGLPFIGVPWREQIRLTTFAKKDRVDLFHSPCLTAPLYLSCPLVVTIHDMIWAFPEKFSKGTTFSAKRKLMEWYNRYLPYYASKRASAIITVSTAAKKSIIEQLKLDKDRIFVTHEAANPIFKQIKDRKLIDTIRSKYNLPSNYIMAIGSADPRKNIQKLVKAFSLLPSELRKNNNLVVIWTHSFLAHDLFEYIEKIGIKDDVKFLEYVPNEDLVLLYNAASLFVFPSLYEGFGLPLLEAMSCGVPVIAADNSSITEIVSNAALLFNATEAEEMSVLIDRALTDQTIRISMIEKGLARAMTFSWEKCAQDTIHVYETVLRAIKPSR